MYRFSFSGGNRCTGLPFSREQIYRFSFSVGNRFTAFPIQQGNRFTGLPFQWGIDLQLFLFRREYIYRFSFSVGNRFTGLPFQEGIDLQVYLFRREQIFRFSFSIGKRFTGLTFQTGIDLHVYHSTQGIDLQIYLYSRHRFSGLPFQKYIRKMYFLSCMYKNSKKFLIKSSIFLFYFQYFQARKIRSIRGKILCESNPAELPSCLLPNFGNLLNQIKNIQFLYIFYQDNTRSEYETGYLFW